MKQFLFSTCLWLASIQYVSSQTTIFTENMYNGTGATSGTTYTIAVHESNDRFNEDGLTYSGTGSIRSTTPSTGAYTGASGTWNALLSSIGATFIIDGINASAYTAITLSLGVAKSTTTSNGSSLVIQYSTTGPSGTYTTLNATPMPTGTGTAAWYTRTITSAIPSNVTTIRFITTDATQYRLDDIVLKGTSTACTAPTTASTGLSFSGVGTNDMTVNWTGNGDGDNRIVVMKASSAVAGTPTSGTTYTANASFGTGSTIATNEFVVYNGNGSSVNVTGLSPSTTYHVAVFEYNNTGVCYLTSSSLTGSQLTNTPACVTAPSTQASFGTITPTSNSASIAFAAGTGGTGRVVKINTTNSFTVPADGSNPSANTVYSAGEQVIYNGTGTSVNVSNLTPSTTYYLAVWEYNCALGAEIYLAGPGTANFSTNAITSAETDMVPVASSESATVSSLVNSSIASVTDGVQVWQFTIRDGGADLTDADLLSSIVTDLTLTQATGNQVGDWADAIQSIQLFDGISLVPASINITATQVAFTGLNLNVPDEGSLTLSLRLSLQTNFNNSGSNPDNDDFVFQILPANFTLSSSGSGKTSFTNVISANGSNRIDVVATQLAFLQQPPSVVGTNQPMSPAVSLRATDIHGNLDTDFTGTVEITSSGILSASPQQAAAIAGVATFGNIQHTTAATSRQLSAAYSGFSTVTSNNFDISDPTVLSLGDIVVVAVNANNGACTPGTLGADRVFFVSFVDITPGTVIDLTDNGWERSNAGNFGTGEGVYRFSRTGATIPAGSLIEFRMGTDVTVTNTLMNGLGWSTVSLTPGLGNLAINNGGDQFFFMQGGSWNNGTASNDATYSGNVLYGFNTRASWSADGTTTQSNLYPGTECFSMAVGSATDFVIYDNASAPGGYSAASRRDWIFRFNNNANWNTTSTGSCATFNAKLITLQGNFPITVNAGNFTPGVWTGTRNTNWFDCGNWETGIVPNINTDVNIAASAANDAVVDYTADFSDRFQDTARCHDLNLNGRLLRAEGSSLNIIQVSGDLNIAATASLDLDDAISGTPDGQLLLEGDWLNNGDESNFEEGESQVRFIGTGTQTITNTGGLEVFYSVQVDKSAGESVELLNQVNISNQLAFVAGKVLTNNQTLSITNTATTAIAGASTSGTDRFVEGRLQWATDGVSSYTFPIGHAVQGVQGFTITPTGLAGSTILGYLESNATALVQPIAYCDLESHPGTGTNVNAGNGNPGTDGILDQVTFNIASPLSWNITNPGGGVASYNLVVNANGTQDINPITSASGTPIRYLMKNGEPGNTGVSTSSGAPWFNASGFLSCPNGYALTGMTGFSSFTLNGASQSNTVLPIELLRFVAQAKDNRFIQLQWTTATERNNKGFEVQRSLDGINFSSIAWIEGQGDSYSNQYYSFDDRMVQAGSMYYYRLKQIDFDGTFSFSPISNAIIDGTNSGTLAIYPVPSQQFVQLKTDASLENIVLLDLTGRPMPISAKQLDIQTIQLDITQLPAGVYLVQIQSPSGISTGKVVKD